MRPEDQIRILHMIDATETAIGFVKGRKRADLDTDRMLLLAVVRAIEVIGEAASKVTDELKGDESDIPWDRIIGMRHRLVHAYFDIDREVVWNTATDELPGLLAKLNALKKRM